MLFSNFLFFIIKKCQQTPFPKQDCIKEFKKIFRDKSGNEWEKKENFEKKPKKYQLLKTIYSVNPKKLLKPFDYKNESLPKRHIHKSIYKVMRNICDVKIFEAEIRNFGIDEELLPFSNLSKDHLLQAKENLLALLDLIEEMTKQSENFQDSNLDEVLKTKEKISSKTSRFFELIPFRKYRQQPIPSIQRKIEVESYLNIINDLLDYEVSTKILLGATKNIENINPMDYCYKSLNIRMYTLKDSDIEYKVLKFYLL